VIFLWESEFLLAKYAVLEQRVLEFAAVANFLRDELSPQPLSNGEGSFFSRTACDLFNGEVSSSSLSVMVRETESTSPFERGKGFGSSVLIAEFLSLSIGEGKRSAGEGPILQARRI
jgi:hypothetical protein